MTQSTRNALQSVLFAPLDERLIGVLEVVHAKKPKKHYFLCLCVTTSTPIASRLHQVKSVDGGQHVKKRTWRLRDVRLVNGINPRKTLPALELTFDDTTYYWEAVRPEEKEAFIKQMWKTSMRYLTMQKPEFINVSIPVEHLELMSNAATADTDSSGSQPTQDTAHDTTTHEDYAPMTPREEADFRKLMAQCQLTVGQAEDFQAKLLSQLATLDTSNMHAIMGSEESVLALMSLIDDALEQVDDLDGQLGEVDAALANVRDNVELMEEKESVAHIEQANREKLVDHLDAFLLIVDYSAENVAQLRDAHLSDVQSIQRCTRAAQTLHKCLSSACPQGMERMDCYKGQMTKLEELADNFSEKLLAHLTTFFQHMDEQTDEVGEWHELSLPKHSQIHRPLLPFAELVLCLKQMRPLVYEELLKRYIDYTGKMYTKDVDRFFVNVHKALQRIGDGSTGTLNRKASIAGTSAEVVLLDDTISSGAAKQFTMLCQTVLSEIDPVVSSEQKFCVRFLHITQDTPISMHGDTHSTASNDSGAAADRRAERQQNEHVRATMASLFGRLDQHMSQLVDHVYNNVNRSLMMWLLVLLSKKTLSLNDKASYIAVILGTTAILTKRKFDMFLDGQRAKIGDYRTTKRARLGIIDANIQFRSLSRCAQIAFDGDHVRRTDMDRWFPALLLATQQSIEKAANDANSKAPASVVRLENYHTLHSTLCEQKIACLDHNRAEIKKLYQSALYAYVKEYMGKPLERLQTFFDDVERMMEKGIAPSEIGFQQQFNKTELRKIIGAYPGKEVKKGLEQLYKRVQSKHLTEGADSALLQVVWRHMQEEFLQQLQHYEQLIDKCYAGTDVHLLFTIKHVLAFFSDIAMQH